jgi:hypothetical protein
MATALQEWFEQVAELQVLHADKANCGAVQKNLTTNFIGIALTHREEITRLLERHEEHIRTMYMKMEAIAEAIVLVAPETEALEEEADMEDDSTEP